MDDLHYDYTNSGNQLNYVSDNIVTNMAEAGFKELSTGEGATDYAYHANGNLTIYSGKRDHVVSPKFRGELYMAFRF